MIEWEKVQDDISKILGEDNRVGLIDAAINPGAITHYFKKLIAKEFKLVARGKPYCTHYGYVIEDKTTQEIIHPYEGKNIEVYIREE